MIEIGGYIELDKYDRPLLHKDAVALNCGRNCFRYLLRAKQIKKVFLPYFLCDSVKAVCIEENVEIEFYYIDNKFVPKNLKEDDESWIYLVNFYGQLRKDTIKMISNKWGNRIILDNCQAYFSEPLLGIDTIYTCRKYFGVSDGAFLYTDKKISESLPMDISYERMRFLLGRYEKSASEFYEEYVNNNKTFAKEPIKQMSKLTRNLLKGIDYEQVKKRRTENFLTLHEQLMNYNQIEIVVPEGPFAYPFLIENGEEIRKKLQKNNIYIPMLWPNVLEDVRPSTIEDFYARNILPLPCDQRYGREEMEYMVKVIKSIL